MRLMVVQADCSSFLSFFCFSFLVLWPVYILSVHCVGMCISLGRKGEQCDPFSDIYQVINHVKRSHGLVHVGI